MEPHQDSKLNNTRLSGLFLVAERVFVDILDPEPACQHRAELRWIPCFAQLALSELEGVKSVDGVEVTIKRVSCMHFDSMRVLQNRQVV